MNNDGSLRNQLSAEYTLSYELLFILEWIIEYEYDTFKRIVEQALESKGYHRIHQLCQASEAILEYEAQTSILEFLAMLETAFVEAVNEGSVKNVLLRNFLPALDNIDVHHCDNALVAASVAQTTSKLEKNPQANPQEILFKELLRRWKPKKTIHNVH